MNSDPINHQAIREAVKDLQVNVHQVGFTTDAVALRQLAYALPSSIDGISVEQAQNIVADYKENASDIWQWEGSRYANDEANDAINEASRAIGQAFTGEFYEDYQPSFSSFIAISGLEIVTLRNAVKSGDYIAALEDKILDGTRQAEAYIQKQASEQRNVL